MHQHPTKLLRRAQKPPLQVPRNRHAHVVCNVFGDGEALEEGLDGVVGLVVDAAGPHAVDVERGDSGDAAGLVGLVDDGVVALGGVVVEFEEGAFGFGFDGVDVVLFVDIAVVVCIYIMSYFAP